MPGGDRPWCCEAAGISNESDPGRSLALGQLASSAENQPAPSGKLDYAWGPCWTKHDNPLHSTPQEPHGLRLAVCPPAWLRPVLWGGKRPVSWRCSWGCWKGGRQQVLSLLFLACFLLLPSPLHKEYVWLNSQTLDAGTIQFYHLTRYWSPVTKTANCMAGKHPCGSHGPSGAAWRGLCLQTSQRLSCWSSRIC